MEKIKRSPGFGLGRQGRDEQTEYRGFLGQWKYSHDTQMMGKCHNKLMDYTTPKVNGQLWTSGVCHPKGMYVYDVCV